MTACSSLIAFAYGFDAAGRVESTLAILALAVRFTRNHGRQRGIAGSTKASSWRT